MKEKLSDLINKSKEFLNTNLKPNLLKIDSKVDSLIPNPKIKKIAYIGVGSLFGFMLLIIILGILVSPLRKNVQTTTTTIKKPNIILTSPEPQKELSEAEKEIKKLENSIKSMTFPESVLNIPLVERNLTI
jgi:hypothetical protein